MTTTTVTTGVTLTTRTDMAADDLLTVDAGGIISVSANTQSVRFNAATDGAIITNNGTIENTASGGRAIRFETSVGTALAATIDNFGTIQSNDDAIQIQAGSVVSGKVSIDNAGLISSATGQGIDFAGGTAGFITDLTNSGNVLALVDDALRIGGVGQIVNTGTLNGGSGEDHIAKADGIQFEDSTSGTVENNAGLIAGDRHGINAGIDSTITVTNASGATITGRNGSGVGSDGTATVTNHGTITGMFTAGVDLNGPGGETPDGIDDGDGDGVDIDGAATIDNFGTIQGLGSNGNGSDGLPNTSEGIAAGGGTITNHDGAVISGQGLGILIDDSSQGNAPFGTTIDNAGTITGVTLTGIKIVSDRDDTISNTGTITGGNGDAIIFGTGDNTLSMLGDHALIDGKANAGAGSDTLDYSSFAAAAKINLTAGTATSTGGVIGFENIFGGGFADTLTGNAQANTISGGGGDDILNAGRGNDSYLGGAGNDTYYIDAAGDTITGETLKGGTDLVIASTDVDLSDFVNVERVTLSGKANIDALGNTRVNTVIGNKGNNEISGGAGNDTLTGHGGADNFYFAEFGSKNSDRITDFGADDAIVLDSSEFDGLSRRAGHLAASDFLLGAAAKAAHDAVVLYNAHTGMLSYDHDGKGGDAADAIAFIGKNLKGFDASDILVL